MLVLDQSRIQILNKSVSPDDLKLELKNTFGYVDFRQGQLEIIQKIVGSENILAVMPTGAGKSLCYQLPAIISKLPTIVVSPLVSLIDDQAKGLKENGVEVAIIHSGQSYAVNVKNWKLFASGTSKILYLSPERLMQERMLTALKKCSIGAFVIDEAHCISKWGAAFRPDYEALSKLKDIFPDSNIAAFTATADKQTRHDISDKLAIEKSNIILKGFDRPNLFLEVREKDAFKPALLSYLKKRKGLSGIVYCLSRRETDELAVFLSANGFNAVAYHAGKSSDYRREAYDKFVTDPDIIMVATIAFGMGIDKPDIRYVVHASLPSSMEAFYQEIGRAGRDNLPSETLLFYGLGDLIQRQRMILEGEGDEKFKLFEYKRLEALVGYCEAISCRRKALLSYFDQQISKCNNCDNCVYPPTVEDYSEEARILITTIQNTDQYFGTNHIIDVVQGRETIKVKDRSHNLLDCFGLGSHLPKGLLQTLIRQLIAFGALRVNLEKYGAIEVNEAAVDIVSGKSTFQSRTYTATKKLSKPKVKKIATNISPESSELLQILKKLRYNTAKKRRVPAYVIFPDRTLEQLALLKPVTETDFLNIDGVGQKKLDQYFDLFVSAIKDYLIVNKVLNKN
tara:strand:+ start:145 stop:2016 length:1872 start_codon:yes stop_codon:yes gene_type:complete